MILKMQREGECNSPIDFVVKSLKFRIWGTDGKLSLAGDYVKTLKVRNLGEGVESNTIPMQLIEN